MKGTTLNQCNDPKRIYIRICAGPQRGKYLHTLVLEAKLGRKLTEEETAEHQDGNTLNNDPANLIAATRPDNTRMMWARRRRLADTTNSAARMMTV